MVQGMVGRGLADGDPPRSVPIGEPVLEVKNWNVYHPLHSDRHTIRDVSLNVRAGEVVGIAGLMGAGRTEFAMSLFGRSWGQKISGEVLMHGKPVDVSSIPKATKAGLAYVTEDRKTYGLVLIDHIKHKLPKAFVIAGNVATPEAVIDLENWGADATKVGVGPGKVCITKLKTGFGTGGWQLSALKWCARVATKPIIADGGIRHHGDIAKSVRFGASMVMIGSLFAGHEESPGKTVEVDGKLFKEYYGSASDFNKGEYKHVEGKRILEPIKGKLADTLREMREDLQSSISYAGGRALTDLKKVNYVILGGENAGEHLFM